MAIIEMVTKMPADAPYVTMTLTYAEAVVVRASLGRLAIPDIADDKWAEKLTQSELRTALYAVHGPLTAEMGGL